MNPSNKVGKYELVGLIARGGMGDVYLARSGGLSGFNKLLVVKTLKPEFAQDERFREMFLDEARLAAKLNHRNIVQTNDVGEADGQYYMVLEYIDGQSYSSLQKRAQKQGEPLALVVRVKIIAEMLAGLHHAHELRDFDGKSLDVVHRDVCPANVLISFDGQIRVADFGIAKAKNQAHETQAGTIKGRVAYMSPEHVLGKGLDRRADVFSAGIMLWEALFEKKFWGNRPETELLGALIQGTLPGPPEGKEVDGELLAICQKALDPAPDRRHQTAEAMRLELEGWLSRQNRGPLDELPANMSRWFAQERAYVGKQLEKIAQLSGEAPGELLVLNPSAVEGASLINSRSGNVSGSFSSGGTGAPHTQTPVSHVIVVPPSKLPWVITGIAVLAMAGVVWKILPRQGDTASPAPVASAQAAPDTVRLTVNATPASAKIFIDDAEMPGNPVSASYPRGKSHTVRVVAPGFSPKSETIDLSESTTLKISLDAAPAGAASAAATDEKADAKDSKKRGGSAQAAATSTAAGKPSETAAPAAPSETARGPRQLNTNNPYNTGTANAPGHVVDANNPYK